MNVVKTCRKSLEIAFESFKHDLNKFRKDQILKNYTRVVRSLGGLEQLLRDDFYENEDLSAVLGFRKKLRQELKEDLFAWAPGEKLQLKEITIFQNVDTDEWFFSTSHGQNLGWGPKWVPCSQTLPFVVTLDSGNKQISTYQEFRDWYSCINGGQYKEIPNPDPEYAVKE
ncbi:MAG: hypothetical protein WC511_02415 [Candidatus Pacearchaeota archaeon]